jgi:hypothetical protein
MQARTQHTSVDTIGLRAKVLGPLLPTQIETPKCITDVVENDRYLAWFERQLETGAPPVVI